ncbi:unnamed protein product, partial [Meganyctiphanes norvegica]
MHNVLKLYLVPELFYGHCLLINGMFYQYLNVCFLSFNILHHSNPPEVFIHAAHIYLTSSDSQKSMNLFIFMIPAILVFLCFLEKNKTIFMISAIFDFLKNSTRKKKKKYGSNVVLNVACNVVLAFCLSAFPDIDHILSDLVLYLQGHRTQYWQRSWLHYSLPPLIICFVLWFSGRIWHKINFIQVGYLILICVIGHHIRDAVHHGLWFQPLHSLPPFSTLLYIILTLILPAIVSLSSKLLLNFVFVKSLRTQGYKYMPVSVV